MYPKMTAAYDAPPLKAESTTAFTAAPLRE